MNKEIGPSVWYDTHRRQADAPTPAHLDEMLGHHEPLNDDDKAALRAMQAEVVALRAGAALAATQPNAAPGDGQEFLGGTADWRVGLFWSSSNPDKKVRCLAEGSKQIAEYATRKDFINWIAAPSTATTAREQETVQVPLKFVQGFYTLAHNYSLTAVPPDYYSGTEGDAFSNAYRRCGQDLAKLRALIPATPLASRSEASAAPSAEGVEMSPEFTDSARSALLWVLWHHQGASSKVGQPIRFALGMGQFDRLNEHQLVEAKRWGELHAASIASEPQPIAGSGGISSKEEA